MYNDSAFSERVVAEFDMRQRALSGTRMGQFMQNQAQRCANISCCLELAKCGEQVSYKFDYNCYSIVTVERISSYKLVNIKSMIMNQTQPRLLSQPIGKGKHTQST